MTTCKTIKNPFLAREILTGGLVAAALTCAVTVHAATTNALNDRSIADAVEDELSYDAAVRPAPIDVTSRDGVITLNGISDNILAKKRAARIAETVKGVRSVVNNIKVRPPLLKKAQVLKSDVVLALANDPAADAYKIAVNANDDGEVTLTGTVDSRQEKDLVETVVEGVAGVTGVNNALKVNYGAQNRPDREIKTEIEQRLFWDVLVDGSLVDVNVKDGMVKLSGTVGSASERSRAVYDAYAKGVTGVDSKGLKIQDWARDPNRRDPAYTIKSDKDVSAAVKDALLYDPRVKLSKVKVSVSDGTAILRGQVDNLVAKRSAEQDARNTLGVHGVVNRIKVRPGKSDPDTKVAARVKAAFKRDPFVERHEVSVVVSGGIVKLYGQVDNYFEKSQADYVAERTNGVVAVDNNLEVRNDHLALVYDPYVSYYPPRYYVWYDYIPTVSYRTDLEIRQNIKDELWWSPFVDSDEVTVSVVNGRATLTGKVDSYSEWQAASENAWEGGAVWVDNNLKIDLHES